jgi:nuclear pore complex protein Nup133
MVTQNPLHFSFPPEIDEDSLMTGAEQLSRAILESGMQLVSLGIDLSLL